MKILDRYIRHTIIMATLMVSVVIVGLESFLTLVQQFHDIDVQHYNLWKVFLFVPMQLPAQFYQLFPMAGFLGAMIGLGRLSSSSQLIVMRASGISIVRILWSVMKAAIIMIVLMTAIGEGFGPLWQQQAAQMRQNALFPINHGALLQSIWLHQGDSFIHIGELKSHDSLIDVTRYHFSKTGRLTRTTIAKSAKRAGDHWALSDVKHTVFLDKKVLVSQEKQAKMRIVFRPNLQVEMKIISGEQSLLSLYRTIMYRRSIGLDVNQFIFSLSQRLLQPITTLVMICLAVPFVFGSFRSSSMGVRIIAGVLIGFVFYMMNQLFGPITLVYQFPPFYAAVIPTLVFFVMGIFLLFRTK